MATKYYALLTNIGAAKLANATALGEQVEITKMAVGDGNGILPTPDPTQTALIHELRRAPLNTLSIDPVNTNQIIAEQVIPEDVGGWWIREIGLYDGDGDMIAVANCAETYKPLLQEGSGRVQVIRVILIVSSTQAITLKIDPSVVLATREYVDQRVLEVKAYPDELLKKHLDDPNPHTQYILTENALSEISSAGLAGEAVKNLGIDLSGRLLGCKAFTTPGLITYTPTPGTGRIRIIITGGGGMGSGALNPGTNFQSRGAGGGAGGTVIALLDVNDAEKYNGVVGGGATDTKPSESSSFEGQLVAGNGTNAVGALGGRGGIAVGGMLNIPGGYGSDSPGVVGMNTYNFRGGSGDGGVSYWGGGIRGSDATVSAANEGYGVGGSGTARTNPVIGNFGGDGVIYIEEYS